MLIEKKTVTKEPTDTHESSLTVSVSNSSLDTAASANGNRQRNIVVKPRAEIIKSQRSLEQEKTTQRAGSDPQSNDVQETEEGPQQRCVPKFDYETGQNL